MSIRTQTLLCPVPATCLHGPFVAGAKTCDPIQVGTRVSWQLQGLLRTAGQKEEGVGALSLSH